MNKNDSNKSRSCSVKSKYFTSESAMDESLSDFQETKKSCSGPKSTATSTNSKPKRALKRIRGQKDIRTVLRPKKSELESYSKDFEKVCKKAGIDIDSEQLQLAIALSKSLQATASTSNVTSGNSQAVNTQGRIGKIRSTLQEYGFKVPEVKIATNTRRVKKLRKEYKLILATDTQKKEIIAEKYSQILFQNITHCSLYTSDIDASNIPLYYLASNITYDILKITDTFYVNNLIEKSTNTGNLLRDWSEIPGRPVSPKLYEPSNMNFSEIECSQDELDTVLSGSMKRCKCILENKNKDWPKLDKASKIVVDVDNFNVRIDVNIKENNIIDHDKTLQSDNNKAKDLVASISSAKQYRSCSPDIFDDDALSILDNSKNSTIHEEIHSFEGQNVVAETMVVTKNSQSKTLNSHISVCDKTHAELLHNNKVTKRNSNDFMELTECIQSKDKCSIVDLPSSQISQNNVTKRRSNDYMEITDCVATLSQPLQNNVDFSESPNIEENTVILIETVIEKPNKNLDQYDETNSKPKTSQNIITCTKQNDIDFTVNSDHEDVEIISEITKIPQEAYPDKSIESMDLTQSSNTSDELPFVSLTATKSNSLDDTIIIDVNDYAHINRQSMNLEKPQHIDLTQCSVKNNEGSMHSQSFYDEFNHDHSGNTEEPREINTDDHACLEDDNIDLTQSPKRKLSSNNNSFSNCYKELVRSNSEAHCSYSNPVNTNSTESPAENSNCSDILDGPVSVEDYYSSYKMCKPGNVNVTLSPIKNNCDDEVNIDLTQHSETGEISPTLSNGTFSTNDHVTNVHSNENELVSSQKTHRCSSLGKKDDISIDYDDFLDNKSENRLNDSKNTSSIAYEIDEGNLSNHSKNMSHILDCSQNSAVFEISDKELDYSLHQSKLEIPIGNFALGGISVMDELSNFGTSHSIHVDGNSNEDNVNKGNESLQTLNKDSKKRDKRCREISPIQHRRITEICTPQKTSTSDVVTAVTPNNSEYIIKTDNVTPMLDYEAMSTQELHDELDKFGIKPFKRKRAIQLLTYIYEQTHPFLQQCDVLAPPPKRHKPNNNQPTFLPRKRVSPKKLLRSPEKLPEFDTNIANGNCLDKGKSNSKTSKGKGKGKKSKVNQENVPEVIEVDNFVLTQQRSEKGVCQVANDAPVIRDIECKPSDWVFQKREKAKVHSCRVPLHIAFYNYVSSRRDLREAILCYEPVEIDVIHKDLVAYGHRYDPKELLKFLDKKCITVKTTDNDARSQRR